LSTEVDLADEIRDEPHKLLRERYESCRGAVNALVQLEA
jgi:hypothetical protein